MLNIITYYFLSINISNKKINMAGIFIGVIAGGLIGWYIETKIKRNKFSDCKKCTFAHQSTGLNYIWLEPYYGKLLKVEYKEPAETGQWRDYSDKIWEIHCKVINHGDNLIEAHMKAFVNPATRFAKLRFTFNKNGTIYTREPDINFYKLEKEYFEKNNICY